MVCYVCSFKIRSFGSDLNGERRNEDVNGPQMPNGTNEGIDGTSRGIKSRFVGKGNCLICKTYIYKK